jgi:hypothetical protein
LPQLPDQGGGQGGFPGTGRARDPDGQGLVQALLIQSLHDAPADIRLILQQGNGTSHRAGIAEMKLFKELSRLH